MRERGGQMEGARGKEGKVAVKALVSTGPGKHNSQWITALTN